jgi:hypothetical protein
LERVVHQADLTAAQVVVVLIQRLLLAFRPIRRLAAAAVAITVNLVLMVVLAGVRVKEPILLLLVVLEHSVREMMAVAHPLRVTAAVAVAVVPEPQVETDLVVLLVTEELDLLQVS